MATVTLENLYDHLEFIKARLVSIEKDVKEIKEEVEPEIKEEYLERLDKIGKEKGRGFSSKSEFLHFLEHEL